MMSLLNPPNHDVCKPGGWASGQKPLLKFARRVALACAVLSGIVLQQTSAAQAEKPAKQVFGHITSAANLSPASHGFYSKGCIAGSVAMPVDGPTWQTMRLSRNRRWGHPVLIGILEQLSIKANKSGWNGLLVGDISQPRGGPMLTGHRSHQIGLDADIWLTPMPHHRMTYKERENTSAISILKKGSVYVNNARWNKSYEKLLYHAASFPQVERLLVHPGIKKKLCDTVKGDRSWLRKVRPYYGHHYHFHLRIGCQPGSPGCKKQKATGAGTGCDSSLKWWFDVALRPKKKSKKKEKKKARKPQVVTMSHLPKACRVVANAAGKPNSMAEFKAASLNGFVAPKIKLPGKIDPIAVLSSKPIEAGNNNRALLKRASVPLVDNRQNWLSVLLAGEIPVPTKSPSN